MLRRHLRPSENEGTYRLQAAVAAEPVLRALADSPAPARIVPLGQHLSLLPMTAAFFDAAATVGEPEPKTRSWEAPAGLGRALADCSEQGPAALRNTDLRGTYTSKRIDGACASTAICALHSPQYTAVGRRTFVCTEPSLDAFWFGQ